MANLTGDYDVATEVGLGLVNSIVAAIHENENENYPRFPHSLTVLVDDRPRGPSDPVPAAQRTGIRTVAEVQVSTPTVSLPQSGLPDTILTRAGAPLATAIQSAGGSGESIGRAAPIESIGPIGSIGPVRGRSCWPQIGVRLVIRAWLRDTPEELPEFLHGNLHLTAGVVRTQLAGETFLGLDTSSGPDVRYEPALGTTLTDEQRGLVERILRNFIRADSEPVSFKVDLPNEVARFDYRLEPTGQRPSALLMLRLVGSPGGPPRPGSVTSRFLPAGADFAIAIGRDLMVGRFRAILDNQPSEFTASGTGFRARVEPDWPNATVDLQPGRIVLTVKGDGSVTYGASIFSTTDEWSFTIRVSIGLHVVGGELRPFLLGDPEVQLSGVAVFEGTIREKARENVKANIQATLNALPADVRRTLDVGRQLEGLIGGLHPSDPGVAITGAEIRPEGVVVPGTVALAPSRPVEVRQAFRGGRPDALESWIPGGTIDRFVWDGQVEEHTFVRPAVSGPRGDIFLRCLVVQGTRVTRGGGLAPVSGDDCPVLEPVLPVLTEFPMPTRPSGRPLLPLMQPTEAKLEVVGQYDPWASGLVPPRGPVNLLVHFADRPWDEVAAILEKALGGDDRREAALVIIGVLGAGRLENATKVGLDADATLLLTEDAAGAWASTFGVPKAPGTVLVGPAGELRWKDDGDLDPEKLAKVLQKNLEPGGELSWRPLRTAVAAGDPAPDVPLRLGEGRELALRRLRDGTAVLSFWTSASPASIEQLRQLREAIESGEEEPYVLGIGDGEDAARVAEVAKREQLPFPLLPDPERAIGRRYGVSSWPTTVQVGPEGRVATTDFGLLPGFNPCDVFHTLVH